MIEDMTVRGFNGNTRSNYIRNVRAFAAFIGPVARHGDGGGSASLPAASDAERHGCLTTAMPGSMNCSSAVGLSRPGCWAHVRRKFFDVHAATGSPTAKEALYRIWNWQPLGATRAAA
jgi:hypothetical protein